MIKRALVTFSIVTLTIFLFSSFSPVLAAESPSGVKLFTIHCAGCHPQGGNIIRRGKTLKKSALERYQFQSVEAIATLVKKGKNPMPAYQDRLTDAEILAVSAYVLEQSQNDWKP